jgi:hypothetical protein
VDIDDWVPVLGRYAGHLHARAGLGHHVVSPLGAWMLVALCATVAGDEQVRGELAHVLGADPVQAAAFAARLLADPHPLVPAGAGAWVRPARETTRIKRWRAELPAVVDTGDIPSQEEIDRWTAERTLGLIERFPIDLSSDVVCLLATALATRVSWEVPFEVVDAAALGPSRWPALRRVLRPPRGDPRHRQYLAGTDRAGTVGVHLAGARGGLLVGSVIAADPAVPASDVLAAAEEIVTAEARQPRSVTRLSLFDLPLGDGPVWSISEQQADTTAPGGREEQVIGVLPAWSAQTRLDLRDDEALGFAAAARALAEALELGDWRYDARQAAMARYSAVGFEAAAVTGLAVLVSAKVSRPGRRRVATLRFAHPFAVVAAASDDPRARHASPVPSAWHGLPVFSAWVSEPTDADPAPFRQHAARPNARPASFRHRSHPRGRNGRRAGRALPQQN